MALYRRGRVWWSRLEFKGRVFQRSTGSRNKHEARDIEAKWRTDNVMGRAGLLYPTLDTFTTAFINYQPKRVSPRTFRFYVDAWKPLIEFPPMRDARLNQINAQLIEQFVRHRLQKVSPTTVNHSLRTLRRALHLAAEWDLIVKAPKIPLLKGEHQRDYVLTEETVKKFISLRPLLKNILPVLVDTGLRISEAVRLEWSDVSLEGRGWLFVRHGKSKYSRRRVPLTVRAHAVLTGLKAAARPDVPYVFTRHDGRQAITRTYISHEFMRARKTLKLPKDCVLHSSRHTFCTRLGERGADAFSIKKLAGHSSIMISERYVHASNESRAIELLD